MPFVEPSKEPNEMRRSLSALLLNRPNGSRKGDTELDDDLLLLFEYFDDAVNLLDAEHLDESVFDESVRDKRDLIDSSSFGSIVSSTLVLPGSCVEVQDWRPGTVEKWICAALELGDEHLVPIQQLFCTTHSPVSVG